MPLYLHQWTYKDQQIQRMLADVEAHDRADVVRTATEAFDGRLLHFFYCFGDYDGVAITSFPDEKSALACCMFIYGQGRIRDVRTTPLFSPTDGTAAIEWVQKKLGLQPPPDRR